MEEISAYIYNERHQVNQKVQEATFVVIVKNNHDAR